MRIKKIVYNNHNILGNLELDFTNKNGKAEDMIFIAGENGCGKTTIINNIFDMFLYARISGEGSISYYLELDDFDVKILKEKSSDYLQEFFRKEIKFDINLDSQSFEFEMNNKLQKAGGNPLYFFGINNIYKCIYSVAEVNFNNDKITSVTSMEIDEESKSEKQTAELSKKITQLLVDIKASDDADLSDWVSSNPGEIPPEEIKEKRMKRFKNAFKYMFEDDLSFDSIKNENDHKEIYFKRKDKLISIDNLSSGEKQIVYRGSFILKNSTKLVNSIILIDEPELSLHPIWQQKITEYFRRMCLDENGKQVCQIIVSTHSPFILHSEERKNDKVIILKRNNDGIIFQPDDKKFYKCTSIETIEEAFSLNEYISEIKDFGNKTIIITEGKTDYKHLQNAMERLNITDLDIEFFEISDTWGDSKLETLLENLKLMPRENKVIGIFDRDKDSILKNYNLYNEEFVELGKNVYAFAIPIVRDYGDKISIEHYYKRDDLKKEDKMGRRLFLGEEFSKNSSKSLDNNYYTKISQIQNKVDINGIIDEKVYRNDDIEAQNSVALSKNAFAELVNDTEFSKNFDFSEFENIFNIIRKIINIK